MNPSNPYAIDSFKKAEKARNLKAAMSYLWLLSFWTMLTNNGDAFIAMHARQGVTITLLTLPLIVPQLGPLLFPFLGTAAILIYAVGFYTAYKGMQTKIPGIWELSQKIFRSKYVE